MTRKFPPDFLSKYEVLKELGRGGMGVVLLCKQLNLNRTVAVKILHPSDNSSSSRGRFRREAKLLCSLHHKNIVKIYDYGLAGNMQYITQEYLEGHPLDEILRGPLPLERTVDYGLQITEGLIYAHDKEIIHRDLKPGNIFVTPKEDLKILDFGLALGSEQLTRLTEAGTIVGTPNYMAPEQVSTTDVDASADLYALGSILYSMVSGQAPFDHALNFEELVAMKLCGSHRPLCALQSPSIPLELEELIEELLSTDPDKRPQDGNEVKERLLAIKEGKRSGRRRQETRASEPIEEDAVDRAKSKTRMPLIGSLIAVLCLLSVLYLAKSSQKPIVECKFIETSVETGMLCFRIRAKSTMECRLICMVTDSSSQKNFAPIILPNDDEWLTTIGNLEPRKGYEVSLSLRHEGKIKARKNLTIETKAWKAKTVIKSERLYYPALTFKNSIIYCSAKGNLFCHSIKDFGLIWKRSNDVSLGGLLGLGNIIYLAEKGRHFVQALNPITGKTIWKRPIDDSADAQMYNTGDYIFVRMKKAGIFCLDANYGKTIWHTNAYARPPWVVTGQSVIHNVEDFNAPRRVIREASTGKIKDEQTTLSFIAKTNYIQVKEKLYFGNGIGEIMGGSIGAIPHEICETIGNPNVLAASEKLICYRSQTPNVLALHSLPSGRLLFQIEIDLPWHKDEVLCIDKDLVLHAHPHKGLSVYCSHSGQRLYFSNGDCVNQFGVLTIESGYLHTQNECEILLLPYPELWPPDQYLLLQ